MVKKSTIQIAFATGLSIFTLASACLGSMAWFYSATEIEDVHIKGSSAGAYFAYGNGKSKTYDENTHDQAYGISLPRHLYNLAWLQYMGEFKDGQYYFELAADIDMTGYVLPPIGTTTYPFVGYFNGNGYKITGLTVSTDENALFESAHHPETSQVTYIEPEIVGLFGVVGNYNDGSGKYAYTGSYSSSKNKIEDLVIDNITVNTSTTKALVGMVAGYVDGDVSNITVDNSTIYVANNTTTALSPSSLTGQLSDHGVVGYATTSHKFNVKRCNDTAYQITTGNETFVADTSGSTSAWGGSIDMKSVHDRLNDIRNNYAARQTSFYDTYTHYYDADGNMKTNETERETSGDYYNTRRTYSPSYSSTKTYNEKLGSFIFWSNSTSDATSTSTQTFHYMAGGHDTVNYYDQYRSHSGKRITDGTNYLNIASLSTSSSSRNAGTINNLVKTGDTEPNATAWSLPDNSGYISTTYYYNNGNTSYTYYLYNYNGNLRLSCGDNYRTTWTKVTYDGKVTYTSTYNNNTYCLKYNGSSWVLVAMTTAPTYTWETEHPAPTSVETWTASHPEPQLSSYTLNANDNTKFYANSYQIYYETNGVKYFLVATAQNSFTVVTGIANLASCHGWSITNINSGSQNAKIRADYSANYTTLNTYLYPNGSQNGAELRVQNSNYSWKVAGDSNSKLYSITRDNLRYSGNNYATHYVAFNGTTFTLSRDSSQVYIDTTANLVSEYNTTIGQQAFDTALSNWETEKEPIETAYNNWLEQRNQALEAFNTQYANWASNYYLLNETSNTSTTGFDYQSDATNSSGYEYFTQYNGQNIYDSTYFPININSANDVSKDPSLTLYEPTDNNTGYFVGGGLSNTRFGRHTISSYLSTNSYQNNKFKSVKTYDGSDTTITSTYASSHFEKYTKTIEKLEGIMKNQTYVYGMHFTDATISMDSKAVAKWASINNDEKTDYELVANSVDFNLKEPGIINFVAGTYGKFSNSSRTSDVDSFFSLNIVVRDENEKITDIEEIAEIYTDGVNSHSYVYKLTNGKYTTPYAYDPTNRNHLLKLKGDGSTSEEDLPFNGQYTQISSLPTTYNTLLFKTEWLKKTGYNNSDTQSAYYTPKYAYYFEIKVNEGEYALGSVNNGKFGAYLMYLDIGASALSLSRTTIYEHFKQMEYAYTYLDGISLKDKNDLSAFNHRDTVLVSLAPGFHGDLIIDRDSDGDEVTITGIGTYASVVYVNENRITSMHKSSEEGGGTISLVSTAVVTDTYRLRYIDYNENTGGVVETVIQESFIDNVSQGRTYEQHYTDGTEADFGVYNSVEYGATVDADGNTADVASGAKLNDTQINSIPIQRAANTIIIAYQFDGYSEDGYTSCTRTFTITYDDLINGPIFEDEVTGYTIQITPVGGSVDVYILTINRTNGHPDGETYVIKINNGDPITAIYPTQDIIVVRP